MNKYIYFCKVCGKNFCDEQEHKEHELRCSKMVALEKLQQKYGYKDQDFNCCQNCRGYRTYKNKDSFTRSICTALYPSRSDELQPLVDQFGICELYGRQMHYNEVHPTWKWQIEE